MADHLRTGKSGETAAADFLRQQGFDILETNWRFSRAEVDLIAREGNILVFVEVKTRRSRRHGPPSVFVSRKKMRLIADAAQVYMRQIQHEWEVRFDIISIIWARHQQPEIEHYRDAFFPPLK
jgi:putative endonuclease